MHWQHVIILDSSQGPPERSSSLYVAVYSLGSSFHFWGNGNLQKLCHRWQQLFFFLRIYSWLKIFFLTAPQNVQYQSFTLRPSEASSVHRLLHSSLIPAQTRTSLSHHPVPCTRVPSVVKNCPLSSYFSVSFPPVGTSRSPGPHNSKQRLFLQASWAQLLCPDFYKPKGNAKS